jgi:hypothetical protein
LGSTTLVATAVAHRRVERVAALHEDAHPRHGRERVERGHDAAAPGDQRPIEALGHGDGRRETGERDEHQGFRYFARNANTRSIESRASSLSP